MIDVIVMKSKRVIIPFQLQKQILQQLHNNHVGIEKMRLPVCKSIYCLNRNTDKDNIVKQCTTCLDYQHAQLQQKEYPTSSQPCHGK